MSQPVVIGEGTYGCVHRPALKCADRNIIDDNKIVSKTLSKTDASNELREFGLISSADKKNNYHLGRPDSCYPDNTHSNKVATQTPNQHSAQFAPLCQLKTHCLTSLF